jgi:DNA-binding HxlR family transcriptional regulator
MAKSIAGAVDASDDILPAAGLGAQLPLQAPVTTLSEVSAGERTKEPCPVARTLDIIGDRWTILILRDLLTQGARRFQDFETSLRGISPNTLSARLKNLEEHGIVTRRFYEQHPPRAEYLLTAKGKELGPAMRALQLWGQKHTP